MIVFDRKGVVIEPGDVVVCVKPIDGYLALGGLYTVDSLTLEADGVVINPDKSGHEGHYPASRFEVVDLTNLPLG